MLKGGEISGIKKLDANGDGLDNDGDIPMAGIPIQLLEGAGIGGPAATNAYGNPIPTQVTGVDGTFLYKFLDPAFLDPALTYTLFEDLTDPAIDDAAPVGLGPEDSTFADLGVVASGVVAGDSGTVAADTATMSSIVDHLPGGGHRESSRTWLTAAKTISS